MTDINSVVICGRLTKDVVLEYLPNGTAKADFSLATNRSVKKGEQWISESSFFNVVLFGKIAESLKPYMTKGKQLIVEGSLRQDRWEKDGVKNQKVYIVAENIQLASIGKTENSSESSTPSAEGFKEDIPF